MHELIKRYCVLCILLLGSSAQAADTRLEDAKKTYEEQLALISGTSASAGAADWGPAYRSELVALKTSLQSAGDLEGLLAAKKELDRFDIAMDLPPEAVVESHAGIAALQKKYQSLGSQNDVKKSAATLSLVEKYIAHLERLKKELTISGDVESAVEAKNEIDRVNASEAVTTARKNAAPAGKEPARGAAPAQQKPAEQAPAEPVPQPTAPPGFTVYKEDETPAQKAGEVFTKLALTDTGNTQMAKKLASVSALRSAEQTVTATSGYGSGQPMKSSVVRIQVRHVRPGSTLKDQIVNIRFFSTRTAPDGREMPFMTGNASIKIPVLTSKGFYIDCPERRPYGEFGGVIVNVYNSDGSLSYQAASAPALKDMAASLTKRSEEDQRADEFNETRAAFEAARNALYQNPNDPELRAAFEAARDKLSAANANRPQNQPPQHSVPPHSPPPGWR